MSSNWTVIRKAGLLERFSIARHDLRLDTCVMVTATYISGNSVLDKDTLFAALAKLVRRHDALSVQLSQEDGCPVYVRLAAVDLAEVVAFSDRTSDRLQEVMESQFLRGFDAGSTLPLWRLEVLQDNTVVFAFHHGVFDGLSGRLFHHALLSALNELAAPVSLAPSVVPVPDDISLVASVDDLAKPPLWVKTFFGAICGHIVPARFTSQATSWSGNAVPKEPALVTRVRNSSYTPQAAARMLELCKAHKATLTSFVHTAAIVALSRLISAGASSETYSTINTSIAVSLRRYTGVPLDEMCDAAGGWSTVQPLLAGAGEDGFPWATSADIAARLHDAVGTGAVLQPVALLKLVAGRLDEWMKGLLGGKRESAFALSNLGPWPRAFGQADVTGGKEPPAQRWKIGAMQFAQTCYTFGPALQMYVVGTPSGGLGVSVVWEKESVEDSFGEAFTAGVADVIREQLAIQ